MTENDEKADLALTVYAPDLDEPEEDGEAGTAGSSDTCGAASAIALAAERARLGPGPPGTHRQLATTEQKLNAMKRSATLQLGQYIVAAAKRPWIVGPKMPRHLYRMWRGGPAGPGARGGAGGGLRPAGE